MTRLDELPPDQRAALSLLLREHKTYAQLAAMLGIPEHAVHDRAHAALAVLAPGQARALTPQERAEIGDYLLGQQEGLAERLRTRSLLGAGDPGRVWAQQLADELAPLAPIELPDLQPPGELAAAANGAGARPPHETHAPAASGAGAPHTGASRPLRSSRIGGALLLAALLAGVVVAVVLLTGGGSSHPKTTAATTRTSAANGPTVTGHWALRSPDPSSKAIGLVEVVTESGKRAFLVAAEHLPPSHGFKYVIWLYNSPSSNEALSSTPPIGSSGRLGAIALLPSNAGSYHEMLLTREVSQHPTQPGPVVLRGAVSLG